MNLARSIAERCFSIAHGELQVSGIPIGAIVERHGTPAFVYDARCMDSRLQQLRVALPSRFKIFYSVKANPNLTVVRHFVQGECGLEIASAGEFQLALQAGCAPRNILFAGPGKTSHELELAISHGIGEIHVESLTEIGRVSAICRRIGVRTRVALRVNPTGEAEGGAMRMGGHATPFGIDEESLEEALNAILAEPLMDFHGLHLFAGTQNLDATRLAAQYRHGLNLARRVVHRIGRPLETIDFGGGLGIPYFAHEKGLDLDRLHAELATLFAPLENDPDFAATVFLVEPGRFLVGEAGIYVARINDIKVSRGKKFLILDGGMNHHLSASGNLGQTIKRNFPVAILNKLDTPEEETVDVVGPLCTPLDTIARGVRLPRAVIGDLFGVFQSGAYARSASPLGFLSHPVPPEIWVNENQDSIVAPRGEDSFERNIAWTSR